MYIFIGLADLGTFENAKKSYEHKCLFIHFYSRQAKIEITGNCLKIALVISWLDIFRLLSLSFSLVSSPMWTFLVVVFLSFFAKREKETKRHLKRILIWVVSQGLAYVDKISRER